MTDRDAGFFNTAMERHGAKKPDGIDLQALHNEIVSDARAENEAMSAEPGTGATDILVTAADAIADRASQRDHANGERSMARTIKSFNALTGHNLSEEDGWIFAAVLKLSRSRGGRFVLDDYVDGAAYIALAGECGLKNGRGN